MPSPSISTRPGALEVGKLVFQQQSGQQSETVIDGYSFRVTRSLRLTGLNIDLYVTRTE